MCVEAAVTRPRKVRGEQVSLLERVISEEVEFLFVVGGPCLFHHVALDIFLEDLGPLLDVLTDHSSRCTRVATSGVAPRR